MIIFDAGKVRANSRREKQVAAIKLADGQSIREIFISLLMAGKNTGRYNFGTSKSEISGERTCKRRSAKHLELPPVLLEDRRAFWLSHRRLACRIRRWILNSYAAADISCEMVSLPIKS